ncbi:MAG: hypothetical protein DKM50_14110 [Candidatus Margulisiibacteriota bacterium]|nr:MAG: hypothetical protein A2X43_09245 [Candidatus Margulisbacteria bacterium GWD2_39_127]OGI05377.1 MAG: hypothetical protein A2X42_04145 [Candidatus Margulisbacteria bacterium GWF2_38_17]OGI09061.1 MAG: hypothetical protein A2X41_00850 [Candidatus Margulisbacteria bacterium GWE2_39_32]PZM77008.1 MAG: hypothetical protein DKM50_14110 [Candidatus Margulisiibacteriota bacterium]HAR64062.1 hypothetical protein [Candidatus Margulisiibacteriota bacterium]
MSRNETPEIIARYYEFLKWLKIKLAKYPRNERYVFGCEIERHALYISEHATRNRVKRIH